MAENVMGSTRIDENELKLQYGHRSDTYVFPMCYSKIQLSEINLIGSELSSFVQVWEMQITKCEGVE